MQKTSEPVGNKSVKDAMLAGMPSRVQEKEPTLFRIFGIAGVFFILAGTFMYYWNAHVNPEQPPFRPFFIRLWWVLGFSGMMAHALSDRDPLARRAYGLVGYLAMMFGLLACGIYLASLAEHAAVTAVVAAVLGLGVMIATAAPFVREATAGGGDTAEIGGTVDFLRDTLRGGMGFLPRWLNSVKTSSPVQQATMVGLATAGVMIIVGYSLLRLPTTHGGGPLFYGMGAMLLGFLLIPSFANNERDEAWRDAGIFAVGLVGLAGALTALVPLFIMPIGASVFGLPVELAGAIVGILFLGAFVGFKNSDSPAGHGMALLLFGLGLVGVIVGLARSVIPAIQYEPANLRVPIGFMAVTLGGVAALLGAIQAFDLRLMVMIRRELASYLFSPIAYAVIAAMTGMAWFAFWMYLHQISPSQVGQSGPIPEPVVAGYYVNWLPVIFALIIVTPAVTMRSLSEENRSGTLEVLLTAPVSEWLVVLSKFVAAWIVYMVSWLPWLILPLVLRYVGEEEFDVRPMMTFYMGIGFMAGGFMGMGLFFSSLTRNQIVAFILSCVGMVVVTFMFFLVNMGENGGWSPGLLDILRHMTYIQHLIQLIEGKVPLHYMFYHVSVAVLWLFLTVKVLEARRWR